MRIRLIGRPEQRRNMKLAGIPYEFKGGEIREDIPEAIMNMLLSHKDEHGRPLFEKVPGNSTGDTEIEAALGVQLEWRSWRS